MKKYLSLIFIFITAFSLNILAQPSEAVSPVGSLNIVKEVKPAILELVPSSVQFVDATGNNAINANESCYLRFKITNNGLGDGLGCVAAISAKGSTTGLTYKSQTLPTIKVGETRSVEIPITSNMNTTDGQVEFTFEVTEPNGFGTDKQYLTIATKAFEAPLIQVVDYTITGAQSATLEKKKPFDLQILLQNTKYGLAENVQVDVTLPEGVLPIGTDGDTRITQITAGETKSIVYSLIVNNNYAAPSIPIKVSIREKYGKYAENKTINLAFNQTFASTKINIDEKVQTRDEISIASLSSKVDKNIPQNKVVNDKTFAVIIANENYRSVSAVPYALNDGNIFRQYCEATLGIPQRNIRFASNATLNDMKAQINWLKNVMASYGPEAKILFYYAGHGIPSETDKSAYLLPVDGSGSDVTTGYKLDDLYASLGSHLGSSVVFLDACFSGAKREGGMLASARGVAIKVKETTPQGNMVVFSAATGDQTAYPYKEEHHGLFTYFLLEKLQETKGEATLQELADYIKTKVSRQAIVVNNKPQTPTIIPSLGLQSSWGTMKLK